MARSRLPEGSSSALIERLAELVDLAGLGGPPAQSHLGDLGDVDRRARDQLDLVDGAGLMPGAELTGVDGVVGELRVVEATVLVADQPVASDDVLVEDDLDLGLLGHDRERWCEVVDEKVDGLVVRVDVAVEPVAEVGELFHQVVVVAAHAVADGDEVDAIVACLGDLVGQHFGVGDALVGHAVGRQHDDVERLRVERLPRRLVAEEQAGLHVRAAARVQGVDGVDDARPLGDRRRREQGWASSPYVTMAIWSSGRKLRTRRASDDCTSPAARGCPSTPTCR